MSTSNEQLTLEPLLSGLEAGEAEAYAGMTVVPVFGEPVGDADYLLLREAIEQDQLQITEISEGGSVPQLRAVSSSELKILLLDGEELIGAKQNRILNRTILLPRKADVGIPVSCVEQGRWGYRSRHFVSAGLVHAALRAKKARSVGRSMLARGRALSDQGEVWHEVAEKSAKLRAASLTGALRDVFEQKREALRDYTDALHYRTSARGVAVAVGGHFVALDVFGKPATLEKLWGRLIDAYALDAISSDHAGEEPDFSKADALQLLDKVAQAPCRRFDTTGDGQDWRFETPELVGNALVADDTLVHLNAFPNR